MSTNGAHGQAVKDLVEFLTRSLVDLPAAVKVDQRVRDDTIFISIGVDQGDMGKVIGRHGSTVRAIRTLARALGQQQGMRVEVEVAE